MKTLRKKLATIFLVVMLRDKSILRTLNKNWLLIQQEISISQQIFEFMLGVVIMPRTISITKSNFFNGSNKNAKGFVR